MQGKYYAKYKDEEEEECTLMNEKQMRRRGHRFNESDTIGVLKNRRISMAEYVRRADGLANTRNSCDAESVQKGTSRDNGGMPESGRTSSRRE